ncbi:MAG: hypothetical protein AB1679_10770 [Actinomycetota bacterium]
MKRLEKALKADLASWGDGLAGTTLAEQALLLARRLDADPADREAAVLSRELRLVVGELRSAAAVGDRDLQEFLERVGTSPVRNRPV